MQDTGKDPVKLHIHAANAEKQEENASSPSFRLFRFRNVKGDSTEMYDPAMDLRKILPNIMSSVMETLDGALSETDVYDEAVTFAENIHILFEIRLQEQNEPIDRVLHDFIEVLNKTDANLRLMFYQAMFVNLMVFYCVSSRRFEGACSKLFPEPMDTIRTNSILSYLSDEDATKFRNILKRMFRDAISIGATPVAYHTISIVNEIGEVILEDAKKCVAQMIPVQNGTQDWNTIANIINITVNQETEAGKAMTNVYPKYTY